MDLVLDNEGKTQTGELDFKIAAAACYLPFMFIHLVAAIVFLATEPKEHRFVRFHALQSLTLAATTLGGSMVMLFGGMIILPVILLFGGSVLAAVFGAMSEDLGAMVMVIATMLSGLSYFGGALLSILLSLVFPLSMIGTAVWAASGAEARLPVIGRIAQRFA